MTHTVATDPRLSLLLAEHREAVEFYLVRAGAIPGDRWLVPRAEGKWTPAQETRHIILSYRALIGDLRDERKMGLRGTPLRRFVWRLVGLTWILYRRRIPRAVRAPREARPDWEPGTRDALLGELRDEVRQFEDVFTDNWHRRPARTVTHPFFGDISLRQSITMSVVHTRHHAALLPV